MEDCERISKGVDDISPENDYDDILFQDDFDISVEDDFDVHKEIIHFVDKKMSISTVDAHTMENARRFIFAEYIVSYIALEFHGLVYNTRFNKESGFIFNPFCEIIKHAAHIIRGKITNTNSSSFEIIGGLSKSYKLCYEIFVDAVLGHYSQKGLRAGQFLYFCVYFSELAAKCYRTDFEEVFDFAVYAILDAFYVYKGRRYQFIDFAKLVAHKSEQSFNKENMGRIYGINLGKIKVVEKSEKSDFINNLELIINKHIRISQENELEECEAALKQLNLVDKFDKYEFIDNFEFPISEIVDKLVKSVERHVNNCNLSVCNENCSFSFIDKLHDAQYKNVLYPTENQFFEEVLQEVMTVVNLEASLLSAIYESQKNQLDSESQADNQSINPNDKIESCTCSYFQNIHVKDSYRMFEDIVAHDCVEKKVKTLVNASIDPNSVIVELEKGMESVDLCDTLQEHADVKFPNSESKAFELEQNQFIVQESADDKVTSSTAEYPVNFAQAEFEEKSDVKGDILHQNTTKEIEHNFIKKEISIFKEASDSEANSEFKEEEDKTLEDLSDTLEYENLNFLNIELKELDTVKNSLICENTSENNIKLEENFKQLKCTEDSDCLFDNSILPGNEQVVDFFAIYKSEGEINEKNVKVLKGDTILFAEDFVRYIMKEFYGISYSESKFEGVHCLSSNAFNDTVKEVLTFIHHKSEILTGITFDIIANVKEHNTDCYRNYVASVLSHYVEDGLNSDEFLYFCLHFSELAAKFYTFDHPEVLDFALCSILDAFCLLKDDWCEIKVATEKVLKIFKTNTDNQCTGSKIHSFVDNFEKECVSAIIDTLKYFLHEKVEEMFFNNFVTVENENHDLSPKILEKSGTDVDNHELHETEIISDGKSVQT